ncbi:hypothetical protein DM785_02235 [Deinococcus actinosclerus]|nr:hypothetical protein DM785_02235 [Deinococcus actinosclerus]
MSYLDKVKNPNAANASNIASRGFRKYFRPHDADGDIDTTADFTFLGATKNYEPSTDEQTREFTANLTGVEETLKKQLASRTRTYTFMTGSTGDKDVTALFYGSAPVSGASGHTTLSAVEDTGAATTGDTVLVFEPSEGLAAVAYYPSESLRGTGPGDEDGFQTYEFEATIQSLSGWTAPATLVNMGRSTPQGIVYTVPKADLDDFLDDLFTTLQPAV